AADIGDLQAGQAAPAPGPVGDRPGAGRLPRLWSAHPLAITPRVLGGQRRPVRPGTGQRPGRIAGGGRTTPGVATIVMVGTAPGGRASSGRLCRTPAPARDPARNGPRPAPAARTVSALRAGAGPDTGQREEPAGRRSGASLAGDVTLRRGADVDRPCHGHATQGPSPGLTSSGGSPDEAGSCAEPGHGLPRKPFHAPPNLPLRRRQTTRSVTLPACSCRMAWT